MNNLTKRQLEILGCLGKGLCNKDIAQALNISRLTVPKHLAHIYKKLGVHSRSQAQAIAKKALDIEVANLRLAARLFSFLALNQEEPHATHNN